MQALMLAAGMGKRLGKFTNNNTKCMVEVANEKLIDRAIDAIKIAGIKKMILVVGYKGENLINYIKSKYTNSEIDFVFINNTDYNISNNIYSFYLAKDYISEDDTILLESDLIYDKNLIKKIVEDEHKNIAVIAKYKSWMDGTVVTCNNNNFITAFIDKTDMDYTNLDQYYKTVNIYKFSKEFCKTIYIPFLKAYMTAFGLNSYYETTLKAVSMLSKNQIYGYELGKTPWYEIDDAQDLDIANSIFCTGIKKYELFSSKEGGLWRYCDLIDFSNDTNPYFPNMNILNKLKSDMHILINKRCSNLNIQSLNVERISGIDEKFILVGNGENQLLKCLENAIGKHTIATNSLKDFDSCFTNYEKIKINHLVMTDFKKEFYNSICKKIDVLYLHNPNDITGNIFSKQDIFDILNIAKQYNIIVIINETFTELVNKENNPSILSNQILQNYPNLIILKDLGKSFGVQGLNIAYIATSNLEILNLAKNQLPTENINSFSEYFLQIINLYTKDFNTACEKLQEESLRVINALKNNKNIKLYPTESNTLLIDLLNNSAKDFCINALQNYNIFIKYIPNYNKNLISIKLQKTYENDLLINLLKQL